MSIGLLASIERLMSDIEDELEDTLPSPWVDATTEGSEIIESTLDGKFCVGEEVGAEGVEAVTVEDNVCREWVLSSGVGSNVFLDDLPVLQRETLAFLLLTTIEVPLLGVDDSLPLVPDPVLREAGDKVDPVADPVLGAAGDEADSVESLDKTCKSGGTGMI